MKYVYAIMTVIDNNPIMKTCISEKRLNGRQILDKYIFTEEERRRYKGWVDEKEILQDMNKVQSIRVEIQEVEV